MLNPKNFTRFWLPVRTLVTSTNSAKSTVIVEKFKAVTILTINRLDKQNAFNESLLTELAARLTEFEDDKNSSVVVVHGGGGNFSAGYDIDELKERSEQNDFEAVRRSLVLPFRRKTGKPFLCSISGMCRSIGFEISLMCDIRYAEEKSVFTFNNRQYGIPLLNDGPKRLGQLIGVPNAVSFLTLDQQINADEAANMGIIYEVVKDGTALGGALKTAVHLSSQPELALCHDLMNLRGENLNILENADNYSSILKTIQSNIHLSAESLKSARVSKLNNMAAWELEEIEHERNYEKNNKQLS